MPKKNGISKTFSFHPETVDKLKALSEWLMRNPTNVIEVLVDEAYKLEAKKQSK